MVNTIMMEVQQVTTHSQSKAAKWEVQDDIRKEAKDEVEITNEANIDRMGHDVAAKASSSYLEDTMMGEDPVW